MRLIGPKPHLLFAALLLTQAVPALAAITVSGTIQRTFPADQCGSISGCTCATPTQTTAVRYATVEIRSTANVSLATTSTASNGTFSVSVAALSAGSTFRLIVWAETAAAVVSDNGTGSLVGVQFSFSTANIGTVTIDQTIDTNVPLIRGALHVMDNAVKAYQYAAARGLAMSQAEIYINASGTFYNSSTNNLYVATSEIWHDGLVHEYGHFIDDLMSPFRGPGGLSSHSVCDRYDSAAAGAFGEGWGNYIISAVTGHTFFWGRWCSVESGPCSEKAQNIEGNVAAVLWDLHDPANESFDTIANEYQRVWDVMDGFQFTNANLSSYMADYADTRANTIECQYTGQKCVTDTVKPSVTSFTVSPLSIVTGSSITASYTVSDAGSGLSRVELWRAPDAGNAPGTWAQITFRTLSGNGPSSGTFNDLPPQTGTFWYGLHVLDQAGNLALEPNPPGPIRVVVSAQPQQCTYAITPTSLVVGGSTGTGSVQVTGSPSGCSGSWTAGSSDGWLTLTGTTGGSSSGSWQVAYSYSTNPSTTSTRNGTISFSGSFPSGGTFTLTQSPSNPGACSYTIAPSSASGAGGGGTGSVQVTGTPGGCTGSWSASSTMSWLTLTGTSGGVGSGSWQVGYSYSANPSTTSTRSANIAFTGSFPSGGTFTLTQSAGPANLPNLTPYQPAGWSDKIVVSKAPGTNTNDTSFSPSDTLYVDWAEANLGAAATSSLHYIELRVDGVLVDYWYVDAGFLNGYYAAVPDYVLGTLTPGSHTITLIADSTNAVAESDETDNQYTRTIVIGGAAIPIPDFNADGKADIIWRHNGTGTNYAWFMSGAVQIGANYIPAVADTNWRIIGVGDFNADGKTDIAWRNLATGIDYLWYMNGVVQSTATYLPTESDLNWNAVGVADFNGDGAPDILWRHAVTGQNRIWLMNNAVLSSVVTLEAIADSQWRIEGAADMNGDGSRDIVWRHYGTGTNYVWFMTGTAHTSSGYLAAVPDTSWEIEALADYDGNGSTDIVWRQYTTGTNYIWFMNGTAQTGAAYLPAVPDSLWRISGPR